MTIRRRSSPPELAVSGLVEVPRGWDVAALDALDGVVEDLGRVAPGFTGAAVPVAALLAASGPLPEATHATVGSDDGHYRASIPLHDLAGKGWLAFREADGELARDRGGPFRLVVPRGRTLCWNVKGVVAITVTAGPEPDSVPANPPH